MSPLVRGFFWILLGLFAFCPSTSYGQNNFDFRYACWGASKAEVKATENDKKIAYDDDNIFVVKDILNGLDVEVVYLFVDDKLVRTKYMIKEKYSNPDMYIAKYNELFDLMSSKYGKGKKSSILSPEYKRNPANLGIGVGLGKVNFFSEWKTPKTEINMILTGNNFDITLGIEYSSIELAPLEAAKKKKKVLDKL